MTLVETQVGEAVLNTAPEGNVKVNFEFELILMPVRAIVRVTT